LVQRFNETCTEEDWMRDVTRLFARLIAGG